MRALVPKRNSCDPTVQARLSLMKTRVARRPCTQVLSSPPSGVNGAFEPLPCSTIGNAASVCWRFTGPNKLSYQENAGLK